MKKLYTGIVLFLSPLMGWAQTNTAVASGPWETAANWSLGHVPLATEDVVVPLSCAMTINASDVCLSLTINTGGSVTITSAQNISIAGSFTNNGTFTASTVGSSITFNAASNSIISGTGSYTVKSTIVLDMGAPSTILDDQSTNFSNALTGSFTLTQGTFIQDNAGSISDCYTNTNTQLIIPNTVTIQVNAPGAMYLCQHGTENNILLEGELFINGGTVAVAGDQGYNAGIDFQYHVVGGISPVLKMTGGAFYIFAGFNWLATSDYVNFNMSGGTIYAAYSIGASHGGYSDSATFCLNDVLGGQTVMTGGTIILQDADNNNTENDLDMGGANVAATLYSVTGGDVQFGYINTQAGSSFFGITPHATTNYPNFDFQAGTAKHASPYFSGQAINIMSLHINSNMTWNASYYNNPVYFTGSTGGYTLNDQGTFTPGSGMYYFSGTFGQVITGNTTVPFNKVTINNSNGVTLTTPATVSGSFVLTSGLLNTTATNILTILAGGTSSAGSTTSYVNGPMAKTGNTAFTFPIGSSGRFMPLGMSAPATVTNDITAQYTRATPVNPYSVNAPLTNVSTMEYWTMTETVLTDAVTVTLYWQNGPSSGIFNYNNTLHVANYDGAAWDDLGQSAITGVFPGVGSVTANATITNFSSMPVTFGSTNGNINPLPVTLTSFAANYIPENNSVMTNWTVATQLNNKEFIVEKTLDGTNYQEVATIAGAGTTPFTLSYSAVDPNPTPGVSYYRLKQVDMDGTPTVFSPVEIYIENQQTYNTLLNLYPNPVSSTTNLTYTSADGNAVMIDIIDASGRTVRSFEYSNVQAGENNFTLNVSGLSHGVYFLRITDSQKVSKLEFVKL